MKQFKSQTLVMNVIHTVRHSGSRKQTQILKSSLKILENFLIEQLQLTSPEAIDLNVTICGKQRIQSLNRDYRQKNKVTDVLSFPLFDSLRSKQASHRNFLPPMLSLGDIFICHEVAKLQAKEFDISYEDEIIHLLIHGFLHLCGFDHELSRKEERIMSNLESNLLAQISGEVNGSST